MTLEQYRLLIGTALSVARLLQHAGMPTTARLLRESVDAAVTEWDAIEEEAREEAA